MLGLHFYTLSPLEKLFCHQIFKMALAVNTTLVFLLSKCPGSKLSPYIKVRRLIKLVDQLEPCYSLWTLSFCKQWICQSFRVSYFLYDKWKSYHETRLDAKLRLSHMHYGVVLHIEIYLHDKIQLRTFDISKWGFKFIHWPFVENGTMLPNP